MTPSEQERDTARAWLRTHFSWAGADQAIGSLAALIASERAAARAEALEEAAELAESPRAKLGCDEFGSRRQCHVAIARGIRALAGGETKEPTK